MKIYTGLNMVLIPYHWRSFVRYLELLEPLIKEVFEDWTQDLDQAAQKIADEEKLQWFYESSEDEYEVRKQFEAVLMNSLFLACYASFENKLMDACRKAQKLCNSPCSVDKNGYGSDMDRAKKYLKELGVTSPWGSREWSEIHKYRRIRNKIAHKEGSVTSKWELASYAKSKGIVSCSTMSPKLALTRPFCEEAIGNFKGFLLKL